MVKDFVTEIEKLSNMSKLKLETFQIILYYLNDEMCPLLLNPQEKSMVALKKAIRDRLRDMDVSPMPKYNELRIYLNDLSELTQERLNCSNLGDLCQDRQIIINIGKIKKCHRLLI